MPQLEQSSLQPSTDLQHRHLLQTTNYNHLLLLHLLISRKGNLKVQQARTPPPPPPRRGGGGGGGLRSQKGPSALQPTTEDIPEQNTDANVSTNIVQHVNTTTTNTTENRYEDITEDDTTEMRPTLTEYLLLNALNTNREILRKTDVTEDTADITDFIKVPGKRKKKKTDTDDETEKKRKAIHTYKIDIATLQQIVRQHNAIDKLPEDIFVGEGFKKHNLLGLLYFIRDGNLLKTDWFEDECPPSSNL